MRTLATASAMAAVLAVPAAAKTLLKNPQRLLPDYVSASHFSATSSIVTDSGRVLEYDLDANIRPSCPGMIAPGPV
jgi:hypothetical protein